MPSPQTQHQPCRILLADDHAILRLGLRKLIADDPGFHVVGEAGDGQELLDLLKQIPCDIILMDLSMPVMNGFQALEVIKKDYPRIRVLLLTMHNSHEYFRQAVSRGVDGYILKEDVYESLLWALNAIQAGQKAYSPKLASLVVGDLYSSGSVDGTGGSFTERTRSPAAPGQRRDKPLDCGHTRDQCPDSREPPGPHHGKARIEEHGLHGPFCD